MILILFLIWWPPMWMKEWDIGINWLTIFSFLCRFHRRWLKGEWCWITICYFSLVDDGMVTSYKWLFVEGFWLNNLNLEVWKMDAKCVDIVDAQFSKWLLWLKGRDVECVSLLSSCAWFLWWFDFLRSWLECYWVLLKRVTSRVPTNALFSRRLMSV